MYLFVTTTEFRDVRQRGHLILWGRTRSGDQACVSCPFTPFFFIEIPPASRATETARKAFLRRVQEDVGADPRLSRLVDRVPFIGFRNGTTVPLVQAVFPTYAAWKRAKYAAKSKQWQTYEASLDPMLKCFHICDIDPVGWIRVDNPEPWRSIARDDVAEYRVQHYTDLTPADITDTPKLVLASWDIECVSGSGNFPDGSLMSDAIITIGTSYMMYGDHEPFKRTIHQLGTCNPIEGADLYTYDRESDLINAWILETQRMGVDVLLGYNTWGFDSKYIDDRASTLIDLQM